MGPSVGLALGGGGARGYAHLGVIRTLERAGIPIDVIAGTSMGAVMGAAYACQVDLDDLERLIRRLDLNELLGFPRNSIRGVMSNAASDYLTRRRDWREQELDSTRAVIEFFDLFTQRKAFDQTRCRLGVMAVDIDAGEPVVLRRGPISRALAAAVALPGLHYPVRVEGRFLVDGGLVNNVPIDVAISLGAELVIAVDVGAPGSTEANTSIEVLMRAESIILRQLNALRLQLARREHGERLLVLSPDVRGIRTLALDELDGPVAAGAAEAEAHLDEIRAALSRSAT